VKHNPENFRNNYNCGYLHQTLAQTERALSAVKDHLVRAIELYAQARQLRPDDYGTLINLGVCYFRLGQYDQAEGTFKAAIAVDPYPAHAYTNLGAIYDAQGAAYEAVTMYRQSLERDGHQPEVLMNLAAVYVRQGKFAAALRDYQTAQSMLEEPAPALERLGYCYYHMGLYERAEDYYNQALEHQPRNAEAHCGLGIVYMTYFVLDRSRQDCRDKGLAEWKLSLEINPEQPTLAGLVDKYTPQATTAKSASSN
jgi:tetratricopeptide (TPR) repeat protein